MNINLSSSKSQANRAKQLEQARKLYLQDALSSAVAALDLKIIDQQLQELAPVEELRKLASRGLRGEFVFAIPSILSLKPNLLAYYRLLLGYSQKEFFTKLKLGRFSTMEKSGRLNETQAHELVELCRALNMRAAELLNSIGFEKITNSLLDDLSLLTLGTQLRGGSNNLIGQAAIRLVFDLIHQISKAAVLSASETQLVLQNAAKRKVLISFASDPDITVVEEMAAGPKKLVAIEIKGGEDSSNIWNRLGEAEKSHQTAKSNGFTQFWTIYNVERLDEAAARMKSPTTQRFYNLKQIVDPTHLAFGDFKEQLIQSLGLPALE